MSKLIGISCIVLLHILAFPQIDRLVFGQTKGAFESEPPAKIKSVIEKANVKFEFYDRQKQKRKYLGETHFDFQFNYRYNYKTRNIERNGKRVVTIRVQILKSEATCRNKIYLPASYRDRKNFWNLKLVQHEFEHVRVNSDPRPILLMNFLVRNLPTISYELSSKESPNKELIDRLIKSKIETRRKAIVGLVQSNNDLLDELTGHGAKDAVADSFFIQLYEQKNLKKVDFEFVGKVKRYLESSAYKKALVE